MTTTNVASNALFTTLIKNPTGKTQYYSFLDNGMGVSLNAGEQVTIPYDIFNPPDIAWNYRKEDYNKILRECIEDGIISILATPTIVCYDTTNTVGKTVVIDDGVVYAGSVLTAASSESSSSSDESSSSSSDESSSSSSDESSSSAS